MSLEVGVAESSSDISHESQQTTYAIVEPFYSFRRNSRAHALGGRLGVRHQRFSDNGGQSTEPSLAVSSRLILRKQELWFNSRADATTRRVTTLGFTDEAPTSEDQSTTALQIQFGPEWQFDSLDSLRLGVRSSISRMKISGDGNNRAQDNTSFGVEGGLLWAIDSRGNLLSFRSRLQETTFDTEGENARIASVNIGGITPVGPRLDFLARVGYESITLGTVATSDEFEESIGVSSRSRISGEQYAIGVRWQPNRRFVLNAEYAERIFGRQPSISMLLKGKRSHLEMQWSRDLQLSQLLDTQLRQSIDNVESETSGQSLEAETEGLATPQNCDTSEATGCALSPFIIDSQTVEESMALIYTVFGRVSSLKFSVTRTELTNFDDTNSRANNSVELQFSRAISRNFSSMLSAKVSNFRSRETDSALRDSNTIRASLTWLSR